MEVRVALCELYGLQGGPAISKSGVAAGITQACPWKIHLAADVWTTSPRSL